MSAARQKKVIQGEMMPTAVDGRTTLRQEIAELGELLGQVIAEFEGSESLQLVESLRRLARDRRGGDHDAGRRLEATIAALDQRQLRVVIRAFTILLDLVNMAEDRHRVRIIRQRARQNWPHPPGESIGDALQRLKTDGKSSRQLQSLVNRLHIQLVFTAHPTEAKRKSIRDKLRKVRELLAQRGEGRPEQEVARIRLSIQAELAKLWLTDFIRPRRPTVLQEVQRGLSFKPVLWDVAPQMLAEMRTALSQLYPDAQFETPACLTFGSWIGGDRDGHPFVTAEVTEQTVLWLRQAALDFHRANGRELFASLSLSARQMDLGRGIHAAVASSQDRWPEVQGLLDDIPPNELFRRWLRVIQWRLDQTARTGLDGSAPVGCYASSSELDRDVALLSEALVGSSCQELLAREIAVWRDRIRIFGFHLARLDVRQDSRQYESVVAELLKAAGLCEDFLGLEDVGRQRLLLKTIDAEIECDESTLSQEARETLATFRLLRRIATSIGIEALGGHVLSMTRSASDVLTILWFWRHAIRGNDYPPPESFEPLPIIPLFETIDDLRRAPDVLTALLNNPVYREYLERQQNRQTVMLGYSDSTKDGGYLAACWSLYRCQQELQRIAHDAGVELTFFHGRGGSLGRGGGPAARGILSLPPGAFHGSLRLTEQGEVLADRYDDPQIAHRHLEQVLWSALLAADAEASPGRDDWRDAMQQLSDRSLSAYRELVEQPGFVEYFRRATPIAQIEQLPIGSRPSRRRGGNQLSDLRAIPWVFSWTQSRCLAPAWFGLGAAIEPMLSDPTALARLREMYQDWPFFRATLDNAELALVKTDLEIAQRYATLANDSPALSRVGEMIASEFARTQRAVLAIAENERLLDGTPWLRESIRVRNRYIDPLNLIQVELLRRIRAAPPSQPAADSEADPEDDELQHLVRLTIKGLAAGMRTTG